MKKKRKLTGILCFVLTFTMGLASVQAQQTTPFSSSLVLDLPLNGTVVDTGPNNFTVTANGGGTWVSNRFLLANSALALNGANQNIVVPYDARLYPTELTLSAWVNFQQVGGVGSIWAAGDASTDGWRGFNLYFNGAALIYQDYTGSGYNAGLSVPTTSFLVGTWYQIVITRTTNSCAIFLNGVEVTSQPGLTPYTKPQVSPISLGANIGSPSAFFNFSPVTLDAVHVYNRALSTNEVAQLYALESTEFPLPFLNLAMTLNISKQSTKNVIGVVSTTASPTRLKLATKGILNALALDKHVAGSWPSNSFPKNATLALAGNGFVVLDGTNLLLNVSDIMSFNRGETKVISGRQNTVTGLASPKAHQLQIAGIIFDDTFIHGGNNLKFNLSGVLTQTTTDTTPAKGVYTETQTLKITTAAGDGSSQNVPFICTGTVSATGTRPLHL